MIIHRTLLISAALFAASSAFAQGVPARVQLIHNCADLAADTVDIWVDDILFYDDFAFRTAAEFADVLPGVLFTVGVAPSNSTVASDAFYQEDFTFASGETYVVVASGIVSGTGYTPAPGFSLALFAQGQEAATDGTNTAMLVYHGSTDAPIVDVYESGVLNTTLVDNAGYGDFAGYLNLPTNDYTLQVRTADSTSTLATYAANLSEFGLQGAAITVVASGFLDPVENSNGPAMGLWAALASGGPLIELPLVATTINETPGHLAHVNVWPNPATENVTVALDATVTTRTTVRLSDLSGRLVLERSNMQLHKGENYLDFSVDDLAAGSYQLTIVNGNAARTLPLDVVR